MHKYYSI